MGAVFPQRSERTAPVFTPPQTHPLSSYPQNIRNSESRPEAAESSAEAEFPTLRYILESIYSAEEKSEIFDLSFRSNSSFLLFYSLFEKYFISIFMEKFIQGVQNFMTTISMILLEGIVRKAKLGSSKLSCDMYSFVYQVPQGV